MSEVTKITQHATEAAEADVQGFGQFIGQFPMTAPIPVRPRRPGDKSFAMVPYAQAQAFWSKDPYYPPLR